jgi:hypothetical protein
LWLGRGCAFFAVSKLHASQPCKYLGGPPPDAALASIGLANVGYPTSTPSDELIE